VHGFALGNQGQIVLAGGYSGSMQVDGRLLVTADSEEPTVADSFLASFAEPLPSTPTIGTGSVCQGLTFTTVPQDIVVPATSPAGACVFFMPPTTTGDTVTCTPAPNTTFGPGPKKVQCTAYDAYGNSASAAPFTVTVTDPPRPVLTQIPTSITATATGPDGVTVNYTSPTVVDALLNPTSCSSCAAPLQPGHYPGPPPVCTPPPVAATCQPASDGDFAIGTTTVTCSSPVDSSGRSATASFAITVLDAPPTVTVPANITAEATGPSGAVVTYSPSATDFADGTDPVTCDWASGSTFPIKTTTVSCSATNKAGMTTKASFTVTVQDTTPPTLHLPGTITATATSVNGAVVTYSATATDIVDGAVTPACTPVSGSTFALGSNTVTCTATDAHHNTATGSFLVQVQYAWSGILQPVNADGTSIFKLGSTVSVKFQLTGASANITNAVAKLTIAKVSSAVDGTYVEAVSTSAADSGNQFRCDSGQYLFNLATKGLSTGTWSLSINLGDGVSRTVQISLR
jgi:hypothetical protein